MIAPTKLYVSEQSALMVYGHVGYMLMDLLPS